MDQGYHMFESFPLCQCGRNGQKVVYYCDDLECQKNG